MAKEFVRLTVNITQQESQAISDYADKDGRTRTEVVRELIRSLPTYSSKGD